LNDVLKGRMGVNISAGERTNGLGIFGKDGLRYQTTEKDNGGVAGL
jgi:hypothetical protein